MTLSTRIAALTGPDRSIDAEVADLLGWWPKNFRDPRDTGRHQRFDMRGCDWCDCPPFTTSLDATLAEIRRRGWYFSGGTRGLVCRAYANLWDIDNKVEAETRRTDDNLPLAALEALVRAVEGQGK